MPIPRPSKFVRNAMIFAVFFCVGALNTCAELHVDAPRWRIVAADFLVFPLMAVVAMQACRPGIRRLRTVSARLATLYLHLVGMVRCKLLLGALAGPFTALARR